MRRFRQTAGLALLWAILAGPVQATSTFDYTFDRSVYEVGAGQRVQVSVYLTETVISGNSLLLEEQGLMGAGVRLSYDLSTTAVDPATVRSADDITPNPAFADDALDFFTPYLAAGLAAEGPGATPAVAGLDGTSIEYPVPAELVPGTTNQYAVLIGQFTFTAGDVYGETTTIKASDLFTDRDNTMTFEYGTALDPNIWSSTAQIAVVPEPSTWAGMLGIGAMAGIYWKWRSRARRKRSKHTPR